jgi:hypothetical protein
MASDLDDQLHAFRQGHGHQTWPVFLDRAGGLLLQAAKGLTRDDDEAADAFVCSTTLPAPVVRDGGRGGPARANWPCLRATSGR